MIPAGYVSVVVCGTRRAEAWRVAFAAEGIEARVDETEEADADKGACLVAVPRGKLIAANAIVTAVTQGQRQLPGARGGWRGVIVVLVVVALIVGLLRGFA